MESANEKVAVGDPDSSKDADGGEDDDHSTPHPDLEPSSQCLTFVKYKGRYIMQQPQPQLRNSLLAGCGYLELANAGDFAANVWNNAPSPPYAMALMALGGTLALGISQFGFRDAWLSRSNFYGLRSERRLLQTHKKRQSEQRQRQRHGEKELGFDDRALDALLDVNFRETGTELIDRIAMDLLMGFGAVVVGVGTFMALGGTNHSVWLASNLLSGYIGNVPCAFYGLANLVWSVYVWNRARRHRLAGIKILKSEDGEEAAVKQMVKTRTASVQLHATLSGITGVVGGAASLVSATMWWGYVVLVPCIVSSLLTNYLWRHRLGYDRPLLNQDLPPVVDEESLIEELKTIASAQRILKKSPPAAEVLSQLISKPTSIAYIIKFLTENQLLEDFCIRLLEDPESCKAVHVPQTDEDDTTTTTTTIDLLQLLNVEEETVRCRLLEIAERCVREAGPIRLEHRERYLLETLGCYMCASGINKKVSAAAPTSAPTPTPAPASASAPAPSETLEKETNLKAEQMV